MQGPAEKYEKHNKAPRENPSPPEKNPSKTLRAEKQKHSGEEEGRGRADIDAD